MKELKKIVSKTTFGFNILQGPSNLNSLTFFSVEKQIPEELTRKRRTPRRKA
jgi:hypothetical protein